MSKIDELKQIIDESKNIVFFGGAGVSTESGIPDFRSSNGVFSKALNSNIQPEQVVSHTYYKKIPKEFFEFYFNNMVFPEAKPNAAHIAIAKLEAEGKVKAVVTQNIDGLHQIAGSKTVYELHGSVHRNYCEKCHKFYSLEDALKKYYEGGIPICDCGGVIKPDVVLYEEALPNDMMFGAIDSISKADTLIIGGTSLVVYPAASFIDYFRGKHLVVINMTPTIADRNADLVIDEKIGEVFKKVME